MRTLTLLVAVVLAVPAISAPAPFPTQRRQPVKITGHYLLSWGGISPGYGVTLYADGRQLTVPIMKDWSGPGYVLPFSDCTVWRGHWRYDKRTGKIHMIESHDGGHTITRYDFDLKTGKGKTDRGMAVEMHRYE